MRFRINPVCMVLLLAAGPLLQHIQSVRADDQAAKRDDAIFRYREVILRDQFVKAKRGVAKGQIARKLFGQANPAVQLVLRCDKDDGMAICAAWWRLKVQMSARLAGADSAVAVTRIPDKFTREFLSFVEGRLHVPIPDGWNEIVRGARYTRWGYAQFPVLLRAENAEKARKSLKGVKGILGLPARLSGPRVEIDRKAKPPELLFRGGSPFEGADERVELTTKLQAVVGKSAAGGKMAKIAGIAVGEKLVLAIDRENGPEIGDVVCIKTVGKGGKPEVAWTRRMDAYWNFVFKGTEWFTELRTNKGNVYLFHGTHDSIGVEAFRLADGKRLFSFNSRLPEPNLPKLAPN